MNSKGLGRWWRKESLRPLWSPLGLKNGPAAVARRRHWGLIFVRNRTREKPAAIWFVLGTKMELTDLWRLDSRSAFFMFRLFVAPASFEDWGEDPSDWSLSELLAELTVSRKPCGAHADPNSRPSDAFVRRTAYRWLRASSLSASGAPHVEVTPLGNSSRPPAQLTD